MATAQAVAASSKETGIVKFFHAARGFGFIEREAGEDLFVHFSNIIMQDPTECKELLEGDRVEFDVVEGPKGLTARNVKRI
jgi:CspA family cold shock protein